MGVKEQVLVSLKAQWKVAVEKQYKEEPAKVINANIEKNANEIMSNPIVKIASKKAGIKVEDIKRILFEIRDEVMSKEE